MSIDAQNGEKVARSREREPRHHGLSIYTQVLFYGGISAVSKGINLLSAAEL